MKKIILTAVMVLTLLYVGLIDFSYAEDLSKGIPEPTELEKDYEKLPISLEEKKIEKDADESYEKDRKDAVVEDVGDDDDDEVKVGIE